MREFFSGSVLFILGLAAIIAVAAFILWMAGRFLDCGVCLEVIAHPAKFLPEFLIPR